MAPHACSDNSLAVRGFNYACVERGVADQVRGQAARIRETVKRSLEAVIEVGRDLRAAKGALPHGLFGTWLKAEFGWTERTARNFMAVAERFGPKTEIISDLAIAPTAAYLLAAPSAPEEACLAAVRRAEAGERITACVARDLLARARKKVSGGGALLPKEDLAPRLGRVLERFRGRWRSDEVGAFIGQLRAFADELEKVQRTSRRRL